MLTSLSFCLGTMCCRRCCKSLYEISHVKIVLPETGCKMQSSSAESTRVRRAFHVCLLLLLLLLPRGTKNDRGFYRRTPQLYASAVLGVVILSLVSPSVRLSHACFVTKPNNALRIF